MFGYLNLISFCWPWVQVKAFESWCWLLVKFPVTNRVLSSFSNISDCKNKEQIYLIFSSTFGIWKNKSLKLMDLCQMYLKYSRLISQCNKPWVHILLEHVSNDWRRFWFVGFQGNEWTWKNERKKMNNTTHCRILVKYIYIYIYIQQLCEDTGCNPEDLPEAMNNWEK